MDVGDRLKALRKKHGLSQRELAKRAGMPNSSISGIENNAVSPTVSSLKKLLSAIPVSLSDFFSSDDNATEEQIFFSASELVDASIGDVHRKMVGKFRDDNLLLMMDEVFPPGADTGDDLMTHEGEETGIVIEGEIDITVGKVTRRLKPGDAYHFSSSKPHRFHNKSSKPCRLICCATPAIY